MPRGVPRQPQKPTRPRPEPMPHAFTYRCPPGLIGPLNEARFILREPTRTSLVTNALYAYLKAHRIPVDAA